MRDVFITDALMPFGEHLDELRKRLIYALTGIGPIFVLALVFGQSLVAFLIQPLLASQRAAGMAQKLQTISVLEGFNTYLKVSFIATIVVGAPWILYQFWLFVAPGLYLKERRFVHILTPLSVLLTVSGIVFMLKIMLPVMLAFFVSFGIDIMPHPKKPAVDLPAGVVLPMTPVLPGDPPNPQPGQSWINTELDALRICVGRNGDGTPKIKELPMTENAVIEPQFRLSDYIGFILGMALAFALAFQMPVAVLLLGWVGIIEPKTLSKYRRHAVFACGVVGAVVTPTGDPLSMFLLAGPLYALYELGMVMLRVLPASRVIKSANAADAKRAERAAERDGGKSGSEAPQDGAANGQPRAEQPVLRPREPDSDDEH